MGEYVTCIHKSLSGDSEHTVITLLFYGFTTLVSEQGSQRQILVESKSPVVELDLVLAKGWQLTLARRAKKAWIKN